MAGIESTRGAGGGVDACDADEAAALAEARYWRELAGVREASLRALTRRPLVRLAVGLDRRLAPTVGRARRIGGRVRAASRRNAVVMAGLRSRFFRAARRRALRQDMARLTPAPIGASTPLVTFAVGDGSRWTRSVDSSAEARLCLVPGPLAAPDPGWTARLAEAVTGDVVAATPTLLHPGRSCWQSTEHDLLVRSEGFELTLDRSGVPVVLARRFGCPTDGVRPPVEVVAAPLRGLVVDRAAYLAAGGLGEVLDEDIAGVDLCQRLRQQGGRIVHVPASVVYDDRPVASRAALRVPIDPGGDGWRAVVEQHGPALLRATSPGSGPRRARWVITTAAPSARLADRWGDWHLADALARSLRRLDQDVQVQTFDAADSLVARSSDIHLVLRGLQPVRRTPGQRHILWVISHPESIDVEECDDADLVLVASTRFADSLRTRTSTPVEVLLQATDPDRFAPQAPDAAHRHSVTVVAKTREFMRPIVADALAAGLRPAIYGSGWSGLVDPSLVVADHVDNAVLPVVYSSAGVVLNDHWGTMRAWGFVSNRVFDVLACGVPIVSDDLPELRELFGSAVLTYRTPAELGEAVRGVLEHPEEARAAASAGRQIVLAHHTFQHRARRLLDLLDEHGLGGGPG